MSNVKTVTATLGLWAVPRNPEWVEEGEDLFEYEICTYDTNHWKKGAVCVDKQEVTLQVPEEINFHAKAVETLEDAMVKIQADANEQIALLKRQLSNLLMITHTPAEVDDYRGADAD